MLIVHVQIRVKPESVEAFKQATLQNARQSVREPGIAGLTWSNNRKTRRGSCWWRRIGLRRRRQRTRRPRITWSWRDAVAHDDG